MTSWCERIPSDMVLPTPFAGLLISPFGVRPSGWNVRSTLLSSYYHRVRSAALSLSPSSQQTDPPQTR
jgi:hypothetical protein